MTAAELPEPRDPDTLDGLAERVAALVLGQLGGPERDAWWGSAEVMQHTSHGRTLIRGVLADGRLHSHQRGTQGSHYTKRSVVDAWMQGATPEQQETVCGCARFTRFAS